MRWQTLTVYLYNAETIKKIIISKFVIAIFGILMIFSAYVLLYVPPGSGDDFPLLNFIMGNLINSYLINAGIIMAYVLLYRKLRNYYLSLNL